MLDTILFVKMCLHSNVTAPSALPENCASGFAAMTRFSEKGAYYGSSEYREVSEGLGGDSVRPLRREDHADRNQKECNVKNGKRPTVRQKNLLRRWRMNPDNWLVVKDTPEAMTAVHRWSDKTVRVIPKREDV